jgi:hypothetical protein
MQSFERHLTIELNYLKDYSEISGMIKRLTNSYGDDCIYKNGKMKGEILEKIMNALTKKPKRRRSVFKSTVGKKSMKKKSMKKKSMKNKSMKKI